MNKSFLFFLAIALAVLSLAVTGCKARQEKTEAEITGEMTEAEMMAVTEPAQSVATETIPPTASPQIAREVAAPAVQDLLSRNKEIQTALKNAGLYTGAIDGKIGPKTKAAIMEFQRAKGLKVDGKVGPKTWAELEKLLVQQ
jgi:peptidoglycan hydrolase-like protein with peptidoglycan-binding domain